MEKLRQNKRQKKKITETIGRIFGAEKIPAASKLSKTELDPSTARRQAGASLGMTELAENPKLKILNPKQYQNPNVQSQKPKFKILNLPAGRQGLKHLNLFRICNLGFWISRVRSLACLAGRRACLAGRRASGAAFMP